MVRGYLKKIQIHEKKCYPDFVSWFLFWLLWQRNNNKHWKYNNQL